MECIYQETECLRSEDLERTGQIDCKGCELNKVRYCPTKLCDLDEE